MEDESQDKAYSSTRHRGPVFGREEVEELVNLIDKHKHIVMNKSICASACHAKDAAWAKMAKIFNERGFEYKRSTESLKRKWENLKKDARKMTKNIMDTKVSEFNDLDAKIVSILCEAETSNAADGPLELNEVCDNNENEEEKELIDNAEISEFSMKYPQYESGEKQSDNDSMDAGDAEIDNTSSRMTRALNFSPKECGLLLQCVRQEKNHVFCKDFTGQAIKLKNRAWSRITNSYNKISPQKRTTKVLRTKFSNMKRMARKVGFKSYLKESDNDNTPHEKLLDASSKDIKKEPEFGYKMDEDSDWHDNNDHDNDDDDHGENQKLDNKFLDYTPDPLSSVLNGDSGIGSITPKSTLTQSKEKEVVKLKMELLNYRMETAKLERKRLEDLLQEEAATREARALETALRLRAARLDTVAAQNRFPPTHPALNYTREEMKAQMYLSQYHQ